MPATHMSREEAASYYDRQLRETYPDDAMLAERIKEIETEDAANQDG